VAATFDGTTARFYINGEEAGIGSFSFGEDDAGPGGTRGHRVSPVPARGLR